MPLQQQLGCGCCRYKEEAEGALQEVRDQLAAAQEERHALERQARDQVICCQLTHSLNPDTLHFELRFYVCSIVRWFILVIHICN